LIRDAIILESTAFHPTPYGGLDADTGYFEVRGIRVNVLRAEIIGEYVGHIVDSLAYFKVGDEVIGFIDWTRRYNMMGLPTAAHIIASILYKNYNALVTGGHITPDYSRDDFDIVVEEGRLSRKQ